ncbi:hypothetical protein PVAND_002326 [Polypedilum vanderplanki]|uniref:WW domain-containing protein n=1 Tax=Polypedilum vanderplanki TaxID=319348 RepID=A0A9J6BR38_POLVA|nr:hypothetical protein PVAND_002326 [Polypedilum vanderplanki]
MPLPAALLARLQKRGIVNDGPKIQEEVFVENHDNDDEINPENFEYQARKRDDFRWTDKLKRRFKETTKGLSGCPNKWNIHHVCTVYCSERWGEGNSKPSKAYKERFQRLLDRYPLPKKGNWAYIYDPGCQAYYFWNKDDNTVSWLPPKHPKAQIGKSAATLRSEKDRPDLESTDEPEANVQMIPPTSSNSPPPSEERYQRPVVTKKTKSRDLEKILRTKKGRKQFYENSDIIDPCDPASYGDCGRGKWSSGLNQEEKGAADSTASGPLFQQRPYPSPGDVLRAQGKRKELSDNSDQEDDTHDSEKKQRRYSEEME